MSRVYVGGLSSRARERDVEKLVKKFGRVREISMKNGFCFIDFDDYRDAEDCIYDLNGMDFMGDRITVEMAKGTPHGRDRDRWGSSRRSRSRSPRRDRPKPIWMDKYGPPTRTDYRVIVDNLSSRVSWQDLKDLMRQAGVVTYADAHRNKTNVGVVEFQSSRDMKAAIEKFDDYELNGRRLRVTEDRCKKKSRSRTRSKSRSRSRSIRRSRSGSPSPKKGRRDSRSRSRSAGSNRRSRSASRSNTRSRSRN